MFEAIDIIEELDLPVSRAPWGLLLGMWKGVAPLSLTWYLYFIAAVTYGYIDPVSLFEVSAVVGQTIEIIVLTIAALFLISIWRCAWNTNWKGWGYISRIAVIIIATSIVYGWITELLYGEW